MVGFVLLAFVVCYFVGRWHGHNLGVKLTGHICKNHEVGVRYKPEVMKLVNLPCFECGETIPSEFRVVAESREKQAIFRPELDVTDHTAHMEIFHGKASLTG